MQLIAKHLYDVSILYLYFYGILCHFWTQVKPLIFLLVDKRLLSKNLTLYIGTFFINLFYSLTSSKPGKRLFANLPARCSWSGRVRIHGKLANMHTSSWLRGFHNHGPDVEVVTEVGSRLLFTFENGVPLMR